MVKFVSTEKFSVSVERQWSGTSWKLRLRCWKTGVGRRSHWGECRHITEMVVLYPTTYWSLCWPHVKPMPACLTYVKYCWPHLIRAFIPVQRYDASLWILSQIWLCNILATTGASTKLVATSNSGLGLQWWWIYWIVLSHVPVLFMLLIVWEERQRLMWSNVCAVAVKRKRIIVNSGRK